MWIIRNTKERVWLMEYPPTHPYHKLKWCWTLEFNNATRYDTEEAAKKAAIKFEVTSCVLEKV